MWKLDVTIEETTKRILVFWFLFLEKMGEDIRYGEKNC